MPWWWWSCPRRWGCAGRSGAASPCWNGPCPRCDAATVMTALAFGYLRNFHAVKMPATLLKIFPSLCRMMVYVGGLSRQVRVVGHAGSRVDGKDFTKTILQLSAT